MDVIDRSWGYNPATFFAPESSYGSPARLRHFVDAAHRAGLAVIFDVVYNHFSKVDNVLWDYDGYDEDGGIYVKEGNAENGLSNWDRRHRYLIDQLGGRADATARAKCRLAWALNVTMPGTPMLFMGSECLQAAPHVGWGYWHDGADRNGDHRFDWSIAGDPPGMQMRRLVAAANAVRWDNLALRTDSLDVTHDDRDNGVLVFVRETDGNTVLVVVNLYGRTFGGHGYGVRTGGHGGRWTQVLCTQDAAYGGWDGAGNAFHEPWTQGDGQVHLNVPAWSVVVMRLT